MNTSSSLPFHFIKRTLTGSILCTILGTTFFCYPPVYFSLLIGSIATIIVTYEWRQLFDIKNYAFWAVLPFYPIVSFFLLIRLNQQSEYRYLIALLFCIVFSFDTGSYIVGTFMGQHPIAPSISPKKTWQGFFGGLVCAYVTTYFFFKILYSFPVTPSSLVLLICSISTVALIGDFFESLLKRRADIKDTSALLPGHGGFLDRFDSILAAIIPLYILRDYIHFLLLSH